MTPQCADLFPNTSLVEYFSINVTNCLWRRASVCMRGCRQWSNWRSRSGRNWRDGLRPGHFWKVIRRFSSTSRPPTLPVAQWGGTLVRKHPEHRSAIYAKIVSPFRWTCTDPSRRIRVT